MLELRPSCEHCDKPLPPESLEAKICSFECTFCAECVDTLFGNVCPNCGGGFVPRPIRPKRTWKGKDSLEFYPASTVKKYRPVNLEAYASFAKEIRNLRPEER
ncbi:DUF1272 domain-containing protein [Leptospira langatensis]|uniref:DUF1272 domain-containing protein n=1 Tax=Leptospira langatensis TaxID=2484983 RepID=A0A5F1ZXK8_9LEPT|nr:DUF1272 domain-containing protein [Leptospira langatensis]TGJ98499.1 DUF1272 domain-containing protein [Leptospira langatensis]TGL43414.1 DUF1272 domain-containing protein [Leptospira langatensis]